MRTPLTPPESVAPAADDFDPVPRHPRRDDWTPAKQTGFIEALGASGCVAEACAAVGMSRQSAYRLRAEPAAQAFRIAWDAALDFAINRLSDECYSRALNGVPVPHFYQGEQVGEHRRYDNRLAMFLLRYRDPLRYARTHDHYVFHGHPEQAALRFGKACHQLEAEAWGYDDDLPAAEPLAPFPWTSDPAPVVHAREAAQREAADKAARAEAWAANRRDYEAYRDDLLREMERERQAAAEPDDATAGAAIPDPVAPPDPVPADTPVGIASSPPEAVSGGDVVSPLSLSEPLPAAPAPPAANDPADPPGPDAGWRTYRGPPDARYFDADGREVIPQPWYPYRVGSGLLPL